MLTFNIYANMDKAMKFIFIVISLIIGMKVLAAPANSRNCIVAEFKMIAHSSNDPRVRENSAKNWLLNSGVNCGDEQLRIISASAASWLGSSLSHEIAIIIDSLIERKISNTPAKLIDYYTPTAKTFPSSVETFTNPKAPLPVVQPMSGIGLGYGSIAANNNVNNNIIYNGADKDGEKKEEVKKILFTATQRGAVLKYFEKNRDDKACGKDDRGLCDSGCPSSMMKNGDFCSSIRRSNKLVVGQPLAFMTLAKEIPLGLREIIGPNPEGFKYLMLYEDVLLVRDGDNVVVDIILDYGGLKVRVKTDNSNSNRTQREKKQKVEAETTE